MKFKQYKGETFEGCTVITYKIDGVRVHIKDGVARSRNNKPLYNIPNMVDGVYEAFIDDWNTTTSIVRTQNYNGDKTLHQVNLYELDPIDLRLIKTVDHIKIDEDDVKRHLDESLKLGYEGLVIINDDKYYKVKPVYSYDVEVKGIIPGTGKHQNKMGALITDNGNVGTGFNDSEREQFNVPENIIGSIIEVECMGLTKNNKFRHPRFIRKRWDK